MTIELSLKKQKNAIKIWLILLIVSVLMLLSPAVADILISFEASIAAAFIGFVMAIISIVMIKVYNNRKKLVLSLFDQQSLLDIWECNDRYNENKGFPIKAYFSAKGVFYMGRPYPLKSYECIIAGAELIDDNGAVLSIIYTAPSSRNGAIRHRHVINIPVPEGREAAAKNIADYYSNFAYSQPK